MGVAYAYKDVLAPRTWGRGFLGFAWSAIRRQPRVCEGRGRPHPCTDVVRKSAPRMRGFIRTCG